MKILMLWELYPSIINHFIAHNNLINKSYLQMNDQFINSFYGWPCSMSQYMSDQGINAHFVVANFKELQIRWALENNISYSDAKWKKSITIEQIKQFRPDVLWIGSLFDYFGSFLSEARNYVGKIVTWIGSPFVNYADVSNISILLTENPKTLSKQHHLFDQVVVTPPGFSLRNVSNQKDGDMRPLFLSFVGSISLAHRQRVNILSAIVRNNIDIAIFPYVQLPQFTLGALRYYVHNFFRGKINSIFKDLGKHWQAMLVRKKLLQMRNSVNRTVFGRDMLEVLGSSLITINPHIDYARDNTGNMRMFEATGMGSCIITEKTENVSALFDINREIVTYSSQNELLEQLRYFEKFPEKAREIGLAGQRKTFTNYTIENMFERIKEALVS